MSRDAINLRPCIQHATRANGAALLHLLTGLALISCMAAQSPAGFLVVPNSLETVEGNSENGIPFNTGLHQYRHQQVYAASQFSAVGGPLTISGIQFRVDAGGSFGSAFSTTLPDIQLDLSTTLFSPDSLSSTFAANVGADNTTVFTRGPLSLSSADTGGPPRDFDIVIPFTTSFLYDPGLGNLLLDVRNFGGGFTTQFDAQSTFSDSISRVTGLVGDATGFGDTLGLVTQFEFDAQVGPAVPEPSSLALLCSGLATVVGYGYRRRKQRHTREGRFPARTDRQAAKLS